MKLRREKAGCKVLSAITFQQLKLGPESLSKNQSSMTDFLNDGIPKAKAFGAADAFQASAEGVKKGF